VSWIKLKCLEYEKAIQIFSFIDVTILTTGLAMPDIQNWRKCAKTVIHHERKEANKHFVETFHLLYQKKQDPVYRCKTEMIPEEESHG
jgi:hypothetical protein